MERRSSPSSRGTIYRFLFCFCATFQNWTAYFNRGWEEMQEGNNKLDPGVYAAYSLRGEGHHAIEL